MDIKMGAELQMSQQFLASALDSLSAHIAILDEAGTIVLVNASWRRFADENGLNWRDCGVGANYLAVAEAASGDSDEGAMQTAQRIRELIVGRRDQLYLEYPCHSPDKQRWFEMRATRFQSDGGSWVVLAHEDITVRRQAEQTLREAKEASEVTKIQEQVRRQAVEAQRDAAVGALREAELHYRTVADFTYDWVYWEDPDGTLRYVSPSCERITGYSAERLINDPHLLHELILPEDRGIWTEHRQHSRNLGQHQVEFRILRQDGEVRWIEHACQPMNDEGGTFLGYRASNRDISHRKQIEQELQRYQEHLEQLVDERTSELTQANQQLEQEIIDRVRVEEVLRESESRFWDLYHNAPNTYFTVGRDGLIDQCNRRALELLGYPLEKLVGMPILDLYADTPQGREKAAKVFQRFLAGESITDEELQMQKADGTPLWISLTVNAIRDAEGAVLESRSMVVDITERKQAEKSLQQNEARLQSLFDTMTEGVILIEPDGQITQANPAAERILQLKRPEIQGRNYVGPEWELLRPDGTPMPPEEMAGPRAMQEKRPVKDVVMGFKRPDGVVSWLNVSANPIINAAGELEGVVGTFSDITERKRIELVMQEAMEAAEAAKYEEQERRQEAERRRQIAEGLADVLGALNSNRSLKEVLDLIVTQARHLLNTRAVGIYSLEAEIGKLAVEASKGLLITYVAGSNIPIGQETLRQAMVSSRPVAVPDVTTFPSDVGDLALDVRRQMAAGAWADLYRAWLAVPIVSKGEVYGGMLLYYAEPRVFFEDEVELAVAFADQAALAIENSHMRDQIVQAAASAERSRLARDLHDAVTQTLFSASLIAEALPRVWDRQPEQGQSGLEELRQLTRGALAEMRTMLVELRPSALTEKPLGELLRHLTEATTSRTRVPVALTVDGDSSLDPNLQIVLYRIAQESLNNIAKHARASQASVSLNCQPGRVLLCISDDGCGFDPDDVLPDRVGMGTMRERAENIGATLEIDSQPGHGTQVIVNWPKTEGEEF